MFVTKTFVFLHIAKTGGTFVHQSLLRLYSLSLAQKALQKLLKRGIKLPFYDYHFRETKKHTLRRNIPEACGLLPVVLAVRNPFDHYVSQYRFNWWKANPQIWFRDVRAVQEKYGEFETMSFPQFVRSTLEFGNWTDQPNENCRSRLGRLSIEWIHYFCYDVESVLAKQSNSELVNEVVRQMSDVTVLRMERLNSDFHRFLGTVGFSEAELEFLLNSPRIYPGDVTRPAGDPWRNYYDEDLIHLVEEEEWLLFRLFPDYSVEKIITEKRSD